MSSGIIFYPIVKFAHGARKKIHIFVSMSSWFVSDAGGVAVEVTVVLEQELEDIELLMVQYLVEDRQLNLHLH